MTLSVACQLISAWPSEALWLQVGIISQCDMFSQRQVCVCQSIGRKKFFLQKEVVRRENALPPPQGSRKEVVRSAHVSTSLEKPRKRARSRSLGNENGASRHFPLPELPSVAKVSRVTCQLALLVLKLLKVEQIQSMHHAKSHAPR